MERIIKSAVTWDSEGLTLVNFLAGRFTYRSLTEWSERILAGELTINGSPAEPGQLLHLHDIIEYRPGDIQEPEADLDYRITFEDDHLLVIDKPGNLCVHPSGPYFKHTLWYLLKRRFGDIHLVNRLDRETSGLLLAAKTPEAAAKLGKNTGITDKCYHVAVHGNFPDELEARGFLFADPTSSVRKKRAFAPGELPPEGKLKIESSHTAFKCLKRSGTLSLVEARLHTGRMHQIRATLYSCGFPVAGDKLYGLDENFFLKLRSGALDDEDRKKLLLPCQALHSSRLTFTHPANGEIITFLSPDPESWKKLFP